MVTSGEKTAHKKHEHVTHVLEGAPFVGTFTGGPALTPSSTSRLGSLWGKLKASRRAQLIILLIVLGLATVVYYAATHRAPVDMIGDRNGYLISDKEWAQRQTKHQASSKEVSSLTPAQQVTYYGELLNNYMMAEDYSGAVKTYEHLLQLTHDGNDLTGDSAFLAAAQAYAKTGNKTAALTALDRAQALDQKIADPDKRADYLNAVELVRKSITQ